jgi:hypothetical protein
MQSPSASVEPLRTGDADYFLFEFAKSALITARFAIAADGALLEAEGVKQPTAALRSFIDRAAVEWWASGRSVRQVWRPCDQSTTRLRPLWEVSGDSVRRYIRVDGVLFDRLTTTAGRG